MRVPARVFADEEILAAIGEDRSLEQLQNVATLPGIVGAALAMPDVHQGYGLRESFSTVPLSPGQLAVALATAPLVATEILKAWRRRAEEGVRC
jgi:tRNA-splicing ligase RtcB